MSKFSKLLKTLLFSAFLPILSLGSAQATIVDVGTQQTTFTGNTRGFWFTAPTNFTITGLGLPTDASTANFDVAVLRLNSAPPIYSSTTNSFSTLFLAKNVSGSGLLATDIDIHIGDIIGVLGSRGADSTNSYGSAAYISNILGYSVTLNRFGMQYDLRNTDPLNVWTENARIGRVFMDVSVTQENAIPEPGMLSLVSLGLIGFVLRRKRIA